MMPSSSKFSSPIGSFDAGMPKSSTAGMPAAAALFASSTDWSTESWQIPGMDGIGSRTFSPWTTNIG